MTLTNAVRQRIKKLLKQNNMNIWKLYKRTGVSASTLTYFINQKRGLITMKTLLHICEGFGISLKEFFDDPLFENVEED